MLRNLDISPLSDCFMLLSSIITLRLEDLERYPRVYWSRACFYSEGQIRKHRDEVERMAEEGRIQLTGDWPRRFTSTVNEPRIHTIHTIDDFISQKPNLHPSDIGQIRIHLAKSLPLHEVLGDKRLRFQLGEVFHRRDVTPEIVDSFDVPDNEPWIGGSGYADIELVLKCKMGRWSRTYLSHNPGLTFDVIQQLDRPLAYPNLTCEWSYDYLVGMILPLSPDLLQQPDFVSNFELNRSTLSSNKTLTLEFIDMADRSLTPKQLRGSWDWHQISMKIRLDEIVTRLDLIQSTSSVNKGWSGWYTPGLVRRSPEDIEVIFKALHRLPDPTPAQRDMALKLYVHLKPSLLSYYALSYQAKRNITEIMTFNRLTTIDDIYNLLDHPSRTALNLTSLSIPRLRPTNRIPTDIVFIFRS
jgi:hypothetical protein